MKITVCYNNKKGQKEVVFTLITVSVLQTEAGFVSLRYFGAV